MSALGWILKAKRLKHGLDRRLVATVADVEPDRLAAIEGGLHSPTPEEYAAVERAIATLTTKGARNDEQRHV